jgi:hypothetical protein
MSVDSSVLRQLGRHLPFRLIERWTTYIVVKCDPPSISFVIVEQGTLTLVLTSG